MGSLFSGSSKGSSNSYQSTSQNQNGWNYTTQSPWDQQQNYLLAGFGAAGSAYNNDQNIGPYTADTVAGQNALEKNAINTAAGWAGGTGASLPGSTANTATSLEGATTPFLGTATDISQNGLGPLGTYFANNGFNTTTPLSGALNDAALGAARNVGNFSAGLGNVVGQGTSDASPQLANDAGLFMDSSPVQKAIDSTNALIDQTNNERTIPQLNRDAAMGGSLNSSRAGAAEAQANEDASLAKAQADASILGNAYATGLNAATTARNSGLQSAAYAGGTGLGSSGSIGQNMQNSDLNAAATNANFRLNAANANEAARLNGNAQLGSGVSEGVNAATAAGTQANNNYNLFSTAGSQQQQADQNALQNAYNKYQAATQYPWQNLDNYWNVVGSRSWGGSQGTNYDGTGTGTTYSTGTTSNTTTPSGLSDFTSLLSSIGSLAGGAGSLFGNNSGGAQGGNNAMFTVH